MMVELIFFHRPMMIQTQKLTSMAFALVDGHLQDRKPLTPDQKSQAIRQVFVSLFEVEQTFSSR